MRILTVGNMYPPHHLGGYELMWQSCVAHLRRDGNDVRVLTTDYRAPVPDHTAATDDEHAYRELRWYWHEHEFPRLRINERRRIERHNLAVLARHRDEFEPDIICWWAMGGMSMSLLERVRRDRFPAVGVVVDDWLVYGPKVDGWQRAFTARKPIAAATERLTGIPTRVALDRAANWVCVSRRVRDRAISEGLDLRGARIVNAGIATEVFRKVPEREWGWRLLYLGRVDRRKGIATAIRALGELPKATLRVVGGGDPEYLGELQRLVDGLALGDRVTFEHHNRTELASVYAEADAVVFPALWEEPWGLVPLEAMAVGRPVIATGTGGSGEYLRAGENCLVFEPKDDPGALGAAVRSLAGDPGLRGRIRLAGFETASRYTDEAFNDGVLAALEAAVR